MTVYRNRKQNKVPGSTYARDLYWCETHKEPAWVYNDGSVACWWECVVVVEGRTDDHDLVPLTATRDLRSVKRPYRQRVY